jgi:hypothetical protein
MAGTFGVPLCVGRERDRPGPSAGLTRTTAVAAPQRSMRYTSRTALSGTTGTSRQHAHVAAAGCCCGSWRRSSSNRLAAVLVEELQPAGVMEVIPCRPHRPRIWPAGSSGPNHAGARAPKPEEAAMPAANAVRDDARAVAISGIVGAAGASEGAARGPQANAARRGSGCDMTDDLVLCGWSGHFKSAGLEVC